ncbi:transketolase-like TK C-terminal-containing protein [Klebsiella pneumoniae]
MTARVAVEAGIADYWFKYVGLNGAIVGMTTFGESAPASSCSRSSASPLITWSLKRKRCCNRWYGAG